MENKNVSNQQSSLCLDHGFAKHGNVFTRCVGDAIYQKMTLIPSCSRKLRYTDKCFFVPHIRISIWSMYSSLPPFYFDNKNCFAEFPSDLFIDLFSSTDSVIDYDNPVVAKVNKVLSVLDTITNQEQLLSANLSLQRAIYGAESMHRLELCAPFILTGNYQGALIQLYGLYAQNWMNFHEKYDELKHAGNIKQYLVQEEKQEMEMEEVTTFLENVLGQREDRLIHYFIENLEKNVRIAKENKVAFANSFHPILCETGDGFA